MGLEPSPWWWWVPVQVVGAAAAMGAPRAASSSQGCSMFQEKAEQRKRPCATSAWVWNVSLWVQTPQDTSFLTKPRGLAACSPGAALPPAPAGNAKAPTSSQPSAGAEVHVQADSSNLPPLLEISFPRCPGGESSCCSLRDQG